MGVRNFSFGGFIDDKVGHDGSGFGIKRLPLIPGPQNLIGTNSGQILHGFVIVGDEVAVIDYLDFLSLQLPRQFQCCNAFASHGFWEEQ